MTEICVNYANIILDEICLEGLDGITLQALWLRLAVRLESEVPNKLKERFWNIVIRLKNVEFYCLPEARGDLKPFQIFQKANDEYILQPFQTAQSQDIYPLAPVKEDYGSCQHYNSRINITAIARLTSYEDIVNNWGNRLVIVGSVEERWRALSPCHSPMFDNITAIQYSLLERIGRTRFNGEKSFGLSSPDLGENPKKAFHHRKTLLNLNLIKKRYITHRDGQSFINCILLHIPRFYRPYLSDTEKLMDNIVAHFKNNPNKIISFGEMKKYIKNYDSQVNIKNILKLTEFRKLVRSVKVNVDIVSPESKKSFSDRQVRAFQLQDHTAEQTEEAEDDEGPGENEAGCGNIGDTLLRQVFMCVYATGTSGATQRQIGWRLGLDFLTTRMALNNLVRRKAIHFAMVDCKKQRMMRYTSCDFPKCNSEKMKQLITIKDEISKTSINQRALTEPEEATVVKGESVIADTSDQQSDKKLNLRNYMTTTKLSRINFILQQIRERHIISDVNNVFNMCVRHEAQLGLKNGIIDRKTVSRIIHQLEKEGRLRIINIKLSSQYQASQLTFVCEPHVDSSHSYIQSAIEQAKLKPSKIEVERLKSKQVSLKSSDIKKQYGHLPKFYKMRLLHQFLYYIIYSHEKKTGNLNELVPEHELKDLQLSEISPAYTSASDQSIFVPPAPTYTEWPEGWMLLADILLCMPLYLFMELVRVTGFTASLLEYLKHPLKRHILIKNLPLDIQDILFMKRRHIFSLHNHLERLCLFGLIKFGKRLMKEKDKVFFYLNKRAGLLDTTTSAPGYIHTEDKVYTREHFEFQSASDISEYWNRMQTVCLNTPLGRSELAIGTQVEIQTAEVKLAAELRSFTDEQARELDNGIVGGDGRGAAGLDSSLFTHLRRSWLRPALIDPIKKELAEKIASQKRLVPRKKPLVARSSSAPLRTNLKKGKFQVRIVAPRKLTKRRKPMYDEVDKIALKNLTSLRSTWQPKEDRILFLSRVAIGIIFPNSRAVPCSVLRDMLHVATRITNKTGPACRRRIHYLWKHPQISHNLRLCLAEVKQDPYIIEKYDNLYDRTRVIESSSKYLEFVKEYKIHFIELVRYLHKIVHGPSIKKSSVVVIPQNLNELHQKYSIHISPTSDMNVVTEPKSLDEVKQNVLSSVIHSALSCRSANTYRLLQIYRQFTESFLREAILKVKSSGMFALTKRYKDSDSVLSCTTSFHLSQSYLYQLCTGTPYTVFSEAFVHFNSIIENKTNNFTPEVMDSGATALLIDLLSISLVTLELSIPENLLVFHSKKYDKWCSVNSPSGIGNNSPSSFAEEEKHPSRMSLCSLQLQEPSIPHTQDTLAVHSCDLNVVLTDHRLRQDYVISREAIQEFITRITNDAVYAYDPEDKTNYTLESENRNNSDLIRNLLKFIDSKNSLGAETKDIKTTFSTFDNSVLLEALLLLKSKRLILRVGIANTRWVSNKHFNNWFVKIDFDDTEKKVPEESNPKNESNANINQNPEHGKRKITPRERPSKKMKSEMFSMNLEAFNLEEVGSAAGKENNLKTVDDISKTFLCPNPWMATVGSLNLRILWRWAGALLCYLISHPLVKLSFLHQRFSYISPFQIRILLEIITEIGCTKLYLIHTKKSSLWESECYSEIIKEEASILDDNENVYVEILDNAIVKFSVFRGYSMKYKKSL